MGNGAGSAGKTTTAWLIRGIFEEWGKLTGMAGTIENAIYADKLDADGNLWTPSEPDPTLDRYAFFEAPNQVSKVHSKPFAVCQYAQNLEFSRKGPRR